MPGCSEETRRVLSSPDPQFPCTPLWTGVLWTQLQALLCPSLPSVRQVPGCPEGGNGARDLTTALTLVLSMRDVGVFNFVLFAYLYFPICIR